jgi:hypothetical protein
MNDASIRKKENAENAIVVGTLMVHVNQGEPVE